MFINLASNFHAIIDILDFIINLKNSIENTYLRYKKVKLNESEILKNLMKYEKNIFEKIDGKFNVFSFIYDTQDRVFKRHRELKEASSKIQSLIKVFKKTLDRNF